MKSSLDLGLSGKVVLVTGAAGGIGYASAQFLIDQGAHVVLADMPGDALESAATTLGSSASVSGNIAVETDCDRMVDAVVEVCGKIDGVVHAAGVSDPVEKALDVGLDKWQQVLDITLRGTFLICRAAGRFMLPQGSGSIVNFSSVNGLGGIPRRHSYGPAKAAVAMLTKNLACEWGASGVRVNALAPAYIETPMVARLISEGKIDSKRLEARTPMARLGQPDEIAHAAAFLLSDLSSYITGVTLPVDGGWTAYGGPGDVATA